MPSADYLGAPNPQLVLYLPHRPHGLAQLIDLPCARALVDANSNHWRKIVTLLAKIASPVADDWRHYRDEQLFRQTALCFAPRLVETGCWHWIGGRDNLQRFDTLHHNAQLLTDAPDISVDADRRLLLTPYPDYRQLSNALVRRIRCALGDQGFYGS
ncbi:DUF6942 family protein [Microbulbifer taiwanensis]|uniref:DUF6942 family protein n=1 Tax=Microbulbifer taiwanensis TaxID=986746 RepID=A0ABW1YRU0_9GAMM|nr:hypothetical protein [Microbulbifer taiwanensis]